MIKDKEHDEYSWFTLRGCYLKHSDGCSDSEVSEMRSFLRKYLARKNDPECVEA